MRSIAVGRGTSLQKRMTQKTESRFEHTFKRIDTWHGSVTYQEVFVYSLVRLHLLELFNSAKSAPVTGAFKSSSFPELVKSRQEEERGLSMTTSNSLTTTFKSEIQNSKRAVPSKLSY